MRKPGRSELGEQEWRLGQCEVCTWPATSVPSPPASGVPQNSASLLEGSADRSGR